MAQRRRRYLHCQAVLLGLLLLALGVQPGSLQAAPLPPMTLWGTLTLDGVPASDGTVLGVQIGGVQVASTAVVTHNGQAGLYTVDIPADDPFSEPVEGGQPGQTMAFAVAGMSIAQTAAWEVGSVQQLDLSGYSPPVADFGCTPRAGPGPLSVQCSDASQGIITTRQWNFGAGAASSAANPTHDYTEPGVYAITLAVAGPGGSHSRTRNGYIVVESPAPTADAGGPYTVNEGSTITLLGSGSDPTGVYGPLSYAWDLDGDNAYETAGPQPLFSAQGLQGPSQRTVRLRVANRVGGVAAATATVTVNNLAPVAIADQWAADEDHVLALATPGPLANDRDPGGSPLSVVQYSQTSARGASLTIQANGQVVYDPTAASALQALPAGATVEDTFAYTVTDPAGLVAAAEVVVTVAGMNDAPTVATANFTVAENSPPGASAGVVTATDADSGERLRYSIVSGNHAGAFEMGPDSGQLEVAGALDFERMPVYFLAVQVTDQQGANGTAAITVQLLDVSDPAPGRAYLPLISDR
jgi:VCBS repeat-containing protein